MAAASVIGTQMLPGVGTTSPVLVPGGGSTVLTMAAPGGLALSVGGVPVGLPGTGLTATAAVGSSGLTMAQAQAVSVAIAGPGAGQGAGTLSPETGLAVSWSLTPDTEGGSASAVDAARLAEPDPDPELSGFWGRLESLARLLVSDREDASPRPSATAAAAPARPVPQDAPAVEVASLAPNGWTRAIARSEAAVDGDDPDVARPDAVAILSVLILTVLPFRDRLARWVGRGGSRANPARRSTRPARSRPRTAPGTPGTRLAV
jgi:hypothetical protein